MDVIRDIRVWNAESQNPNAIYLVTDPVASVDELLLAIEAAGQNMWPVDELPFDLIYRGQDTGSPLVPRQINGRHENLQIKLQKMLSLCRDAVGINRSDHEIYFMMRHAGLPSHLLDWSWRWEIALWFAIHDLNGKLKNGDSSLWVLRPILRDMQGTEVNGESVNPVFFRADQQTCTRSQKQDGCAYQLRFEKRGDVILPVPMELDSLYRERLLKIPLSVEMSCESVERQLLNLRPDLMKLLCDDGVIPKLVVEECLRIFNDREESYHE